MKAYPMRSYEADRRRCGTRRRSGGFTRAAAIMLVLTLAALVITAIPFAIRWREESAAFNCTLSVEKMQDLLDMEVLFRQRTLTPKETREFLEDNEARGEILCPDGGEFDAVERDSMSMEVVCCRHDSDGKRRVRLCAERALERVRKAVGTEQFYGTPFPDEVKITLNSRSLTAKRVEEATGLRRGTSTTAGYKGIVAFYALAGQPGGMSVPEALVQYRSDKAVGEESEETGLDEAMVEEPGETSPDQPKESAADVPENAAANAPVEAAPDGMEEASAKEPVLGDTVQEEATQEEAPRKESAPDGEETVESGASVSDGGVEEGEVWYFSFADEDHAATWTAGEGWRIDGIRLR
ncbi:MAG: hypothetical protein IJT94_06550 [Oscillibacter sp.]|nr:hypothetical protein [Oscillibacter sp.]